MNKFNRYINGAAVFLLIWTIVQDFILGIGYSYTKADSIFSILILLKDLMLILLFITVSLIRLIKTVREKRNIGDSSNIFSFLYRKKDFITLLVLFYSAVCLLYLFVSLSKGLSTKNAIASLRGMIFIPMSIYAGFNISEGVWFRRFIYSRYFLIIAGVAVFGIIDYYFIPISFWRNTVDIGGFIAHIKGRPDYLVKGLTGNFFGDYGRGFFSTRRLVSFYGNPLTAAYFLMLGLFYYFYSFIRKKSVLSAVIFSVILYAIFLTHTRAIIIAAGAVIAVYVFYSTPKKFKWIIYAVVVMGLFTALANFSKLAKIIYDGSTYSHIINIVGAVEKLNFLGSGLGTFGAWASIGTENIYLTIFGQSGFLGIISFILLWAVTIWLIMQNRKADGEYDSVMFNTIMSSTVVYFISGFISEQLFAFTTMFAYWFIIGYMARKTPQKSGDD